MSTPPSPPRSAAKATTEHSRALALRPADRKQTPLHRAVACGDIQALAAMAKDGSGQRWLASQDKFGSTPIELAADADAPEAFEILAKMHRELSMSDSGAIRKARQGALLAVGHALSKAVIKGDAGRVKALISLGADIDLAKPASSPPLLLASYWNQLDCLQELIASGANLEAIDDVGNSALSMAAVGQAPSCMRSLIWAGSDIEHANFHGQTPLWLATDAQDIECMSELIEAGADVEASARRGVTPLMAASMIGDLEGLTLLCESGADIHAEDIDGYQCLNYAVMHESEECVDYLLDRGAKARSKNSMGKSCLTLAREHGVEQFWLDAHAKWHNKDLVARERRALSKAAYKPAKVPDDSKDGSKRL